MKHLSKLLFFKLRADGPGPGAAGLSGQCGFQDVAERICWGKCWLPRCLLNCWGREKEAPKGRPMGNEVRGFFSEQERRVRSRRNRL